MSRPSHNHRRRGALAAWRACGNRRRGAPRSAGRPTTAEALRGAEGEAARLRSEKTAAVGLLAAGVMHEINNPLSAILGYAQFLLKGDLSEAQRADVERIMAEALRASRIVQNLLTFARPMRPQKTLLDINRAIESALDLRRPELERDGIVLCATLQADLPRVEADANQLEQVFVNIINNARDAMLEHRIARGRLQVSTAACDGRVRVTFEDNGPGIPEHCIQRIFDPFFTTKEANRGTGLGLAVCDGIVREHGGSISAHNRPGGGAALVLELPVAARTAP